MQAYLKERKIPQWKREEVAELMELLKTHKGFMIASIDGFPADKLHEIRKRMREEVKIRVTRNSLLSISISSAGLNAEDLGEYLKGPNAVMFFNSNPFEVNIKLSKFKLKRFAVPGDKADEDVVIPAGDTGIPAGPMLSVFGKLKIQTRVQDGKIVIAKDTIVAKRGETIPAELAPILQKLGIQPVNLQLRIKAAFYEGRIIPGESLSIDLDQYRTELLRAHNESMALGMEAALPIPQLLSLSIASAVKRAVALSGEIGYVTPENVALVLSAAVARAYQLATLVSGKVDLGLKAPAQQQQAEQKEKKEEEEKKAPSDEEIAGGLSSLFG